VGWMVTAASNLHEGRLLDEADTNIRIRAYINRSNLASVRKDTITMGGCFTALFESGDAPMLALIGLEFTMPSCTTEYAII
jgi:hypothetical protein